jgi:excisionase family DNA binding protein
MADNEQSERLTLAEAAKRLNISVEAARKRVQRGTLPGYKSGGVWYVNLERIDTATKPDVRYPDSDQDSALVAQLQAEVTFLRSQLERATTMLETITLRQLPPHDPTTQTPEPPARRRRWWPW